MSKTNDQLALELHKKNKGKIATFVKTPITSRADLSKAYTPGVAAVSLAIAKNKSDSYKYTNRGNTVAIVTDGTAVLGLGDIGPEAAMPVMEGKAVLFKEFGNVDAVPICLNTKDPDEIVQIVTALAPTFGGVNLEDISAPRCFEIEEKLKAKLDIPVFHDDQHGTAIVVLAALINALKITKKDPTKIKVVISGAGSAGIATAKILLNWRIKNIILVNSGGIVSKKRKDLNWAVKKMTKFTNSFNQIGTLADALVGADVFIGVSAPNIVTAEMVKSMNDKPIIFALANPVPEIMPDVAQTAGAAIVGTGRSDFPNQINNVLAFPGVFRGVFDSGAKKITEKMKVAAAMALANYVKRPTAQNIIPDCLDKNVAKAVAKAVKLQGNSK